MQDDLPKCEAAVNLLDGLFEHLLDFTAREAVELAVTKSTENIAVDDKALMAVLTINLINKFDSEKSIAQRLRERVALFLDVNN